MASCIVVPLAGDARSAVSALWADLAGRFGVGRDHRGTEPHLTLAVVHGHGDPATIRSALAPVALASTPFRAAGAGFGVFAGHRRSSAVLHLGVTRTPALSALHQAVVAQLDAAGVGVEGEYQVEHWRPHITLADRAVTPNVAGGAITYLLARGPRHWTVAVNSLALIDEAGETAFRLPLGPPLRDWPRADAPAGDGLGNDVEPAMALARCPGDQAQPA